VKTLKKAVRFSVILIVLFALFATPLLVMGVQGSVTIGDQQVDFNFGVAQPEAEASLQYVCCGGGGGDW
jgi:hypothetical protein